MTIIKYPRVVWGLPGGYLIFLPSGCIPQFHLGFDTVAMAADGFNKMHATIANAWFFGIFASFLLIPDRSSAAMRHQACHAVIHITRADFMRLLSEQAIAFLIRYASSHLITYPIVSALASIWLLQPPQLPVWHIRNIIFPSKTFY